MLRAITVLLLFVLLAPASAAPAKHVLLISIDGLRPDAMVQGDTPALKALMKRGSWSLKARTTLPSVTLTSHTSMMTGVPPAKHQVLWNEWIPEKGPIKTQTIFDVAKAAGLTTAMFAGKEKFRHFVVPGRFDDFGIPDYPCKAVADAAAHVIDEKAPSLMMVHLAEPDGAGHAIGWMTPAYFKAIANADRAVAHLVEALEEAEIADETAIIVSADHGGHDRTHGSASPEDMTIPWIAAGAGVRAAGELSGPIVTTDTAATVVALLGLPVPASWDGKPVSAALAVSARAPAPGSAAR